MTARGGEPVLLAVVVGLLLATVAPFALPLLPVGGPSAPGSSGPGTPSSTSAGGPTGNGVLTPTHPSGDIAPPQQPIAAAGTASLGRLCENTTDTPAETRRADGTGVSVAIIDPSGFDVDDPRLEGNVAATESLRRERGLRNRGRTGHGTASAALVSRLAPGVDLYLVNFDTAADFTRAVEWAIARDVDVIVAPVAFYAKPNDGTAPVSRAVTRAAEQGVTVVVPTGNVARKHWEGTYESDGDDDRWLSFGPNDTRLSLRGDRPRIQAWLYWNRSGTGDPNLFDVVLYRDLANGSRRVAVSEDYPRGPVGTNQVLFEEIRTNDLLSLAAPEGSYHLRIRGPPNATHRVEIVTVHHRLDSPTSAGSIVAPATARGAGVVAVGAAHPDGAPMARSSRGPTTDGRQGVDLLAPGSVGNESGMTFTGTSTAAVYAGGVVARMTARDPSLTPREVERILEATADGGRDTTTRGAGMLDTDAALRCVAARG